MVVFVLCYRPTTFHSPWTFLPFLSTMRALPYLLWRWVGQTFLVSIGWTQVPLSFCSIGAGGKRRVSGKFRGKCFDFARDANLWCCQPKNNWPREQSVWWVVRPDWCSLRGISSYACTLHWFLFINLWREIRKLPQNKFRSGQLHNFANNRCLLTILSVVLQHFVVTHLSLSSVV